MECLLLRPPHTLTGRVAPTEDAGPDIELPGTAAEGPFAAETETGLRLTEVATASLAVAEPEESAASDAPESPIKTAPPPGMVEAVAAAEPEADSIAVTVPTVVAEVFEADATTELAAGWTGVLVLMVPEEALATDTTAEMLADTMVEVVA